MKRVFLILLCILCSPTPTYAASNYYYETTQQSNYTKRELFDVEIVGEETSAPEEIAPDEDMWELKTPPSALDEISEGDEVIGEIDEEIIFPSEDGEEESLPLLSDGEEVITSGEDEDNTEE